MIRQEDDYRTVRKFVLVERTKYLAYLRVHVTDVGEVAVPHFGDLFVVWPDLLRRNTENLAAIVKCPFGRIRRPRWVKTRELLGVIQVPVFLRRVERRMRLPEPDGEEERP